MKRQLKLSTIWKKIIMKNKKIIFNLTFTSINLAIGLVLPLLTMQIPEVGKMLLPLHLPVFIVGLICGYKYGLLIGITLPLLRSLIFHMPALYPNAICMSIELASYGLFSGLIFSLLKKTKINYLANIFISLILSMLLGRIIWGASRFLIGVIDQSNVFSFKYFINASLLTAWPGIILQLLIVPSVVILTNNIIKSHQSN